MRIPIKPLSVNKVWQGRRFKTKEYSAWRDEFAVCLTRVPEYTKVRYNGEIEIHLEFHVKNYGKSDLDNFIKPTLDALVECQVIEDDSRIKRLQVFKRRVEDAKDECIQLRIKQIYA